MQVIIKLFINYSNFCLKLNMVFQEYKQFNLFFDKFHVIGNMIVLLLSDEMIFNKNGGFFF